MEAKLLKEKKLLEREIIQLQNHQKSNLKSPHKSPRKVTDFKRISAKKGKVSISSDYTSGSGITTLQMLEKFKKNQQIKS